MPGTLPRVVSAMPVIAQPSPCLSKRTLASVLDRLRLVAVGAEDDGQRHREAARVRRADQLLGVRPGAVLHARLERVRALERARPELPSCRCPPAAIRSTRRVRCVSACGAPPSGSLSCERIMTRGQRFTFLGIAVVIAVVAVILLAGGGDETDKAAKSAQTATPTATATASDGEGPPNPPRPRRPSRRCCSGGQGEDADLRPGRDRPLPRRQRHGGGGPHPRLRHQEGPRAEQGPRRCPSRPRSPGIFEIEFEGSATQIAELRSSRSEGEGCDERFSLVLDLPPRHSASRGFASPPVPRHAGGHARTNCAMSGTRSRRLRRRGSARAKKSRLRSPPSCALTSGSGRRAARISSRNWRSASDLVSFGSVWMAFLEAAVPRWWG